MNKEVKARELLQSLKNFYSDSIIKVDVSEIFCNTILSEKDSCARCPLENCNANCVKEIINWCDKETEK